MPPVQTFVACAVSAAVCLTVGWTVFRRLEPRFAEEL
jgi:ABC-type polysaccharide/polyol phosphate export permease